MAAENDWLAGRHLPDTFLAMLPEPSPAERDINERVQEILSDQRLVPFLRILEQHNSHPRWEPGRRTLSKARFLLGPHLSHVFNSVQMRVPVERDHGFRRKMIT
jgi:hypothetical protein